jgi:hypothetical protein
MDMKSHFKGIIGKTVSEVIVTESNDRPREQVFFVFTDGTYFELYGQDFNCANVYYGDAEHVLGLLEGYGRTKIQVYPMAVE